jgi:hypothetical protein
VQYEGVYITPRWKDFETFYNENEKRYDNAVKKHKNYKRLDIRDGETPLIMPIISFERKVKGKGYTRRNTFFSNPSDRMKYRSTIHKYLFEEKMLGTRDIKNILAKRGINIAMETITDRLRLGKPLFNPNRQVKYFYKGEYTTGPKIAEENNVTYGNFNKWFHKLGSIEEALKYLKNAPPSTRSKKK